jgi:two-component system response regulator
MRILVIDDDPIDFALVRKGFDVVAPLPEIFHCASADLVLEMLESKACKIALLDLSLGRDTGLDVLRAIRADKRFALLPVIVLSSSSNNRDVADVYAAGANAYVEKPLTMDLYRNFARAFAAFWIEAAIIA